jgi:hypothetical protein
LGIGVMVTVLPVLGGGGLFELLEIELEINQINN